MRNIPASYMNSSYDALWMYMHSETSQLGTEGDEKPFAQLDALYFYIFSRVERFDKLWPILGILVLLSAEAIEGLNESQVRDFASPSFIERVCMFEPGDVSLALDPLASLVSVPAQDLSIKILHASLFDFLLDPSRSGIYQLSLVRAHECLAKWRWRQIDFSMTQEMEDEAIWLFLKHCEEADLRDSLVEMIGRVATFLVGFLDTRDEQWWLHSTRIGNYELLVGRLSLIFLREDFPHGTVSSDFVCAVAEKWNQPASLGMSERFVRTLEPRLEAPEWNAHNGSWDRSFHRVVRQLRDLRPSRGQSTASSKPFPEQNISSIPGFLSGPRAVEHARELAKFPRQMPDSRSRDVQRAFMAMRLLFWTQRFLRDTSGLAFPRVATRWVLEATYALDPTGPSSDAALVLFVLSLLPYLPGTRVEPELHEEIRRRMKVLRERTALDYKMQEPIKEWALGLRAFPKITANYRREAAAYLKVCLGAAN
ncbi:hypothetical protein NLJ89_g1373 [Agrocybe chaxingu]|uniref:Uncharacterized protein n=1 Tax=Agrocybe chaxingu TaxID=84603 RepID=A0A9W8TEH7_9AGAR|nr:hypothetical protein NLJ89_g1373 [Agrocybe chaxingu]